MDKQCPACRRTLPVSAFGRNKSLRDGYSFYCLQCNRKRNNAWYRESRRRQGKMVRDHSGIPEGFRWCPSCEQAVAHADYSLNRRSSSGFGSRCKSCKADEDSAAYFQRQYGLSRSDVAELRSSQDDRCAICAEPSPQHIDHDHDTGRTRQLLCQRCNHGLGLFRDDPYLLRVAALYIEGHRQQHAFATLQATADRDPDGSADVSDRR